MFDPLTNHQFVDVKHLWAILGKHLHPKPLWWVILGKDLHNREETMKAINISTFEL